MQPKIQACTLSGNGSFLRTKNRILDSAIAFKTDADIKGIESCIENEYNGFQLLDQKNLGLPEHSFCSVLMPFSCFNSKKHDLAVFRLAVCYSANTPSSLFSTNQLISRDQLVALRKTNN
jgi:hypothetical protein